jgi:hypothetical protein
MPRSVSGNGVAVAVAAVTLVVAAVLRFARLGRLSFWYDEVVTMRLARTAGPAALLEQLGRIDATRAPLHPLILQGWVKLFGPSEASGRAFNAACGVLTVALVGRVARRAYADRRTGLWAAWLAALSPLLVVYSREARMYAWLVLLTCAAWDALFTLRTYTSAFNLVVYATCLVALVYSHPLGLLMAAALGFVSLDVWKAGGGSWRRWLAPHAAAALAVAPWVGRYFDHEPESVVGRLPLRFLLGLPIGFIGGNFVTLAGFAAVIGVGLVSVRGTGRGWRRVVFDAPTANFALLTWLVVPPVLLYAYSQVSYPVFGPARYTLYVGPAFLILVARGLAKLPRWLAAAAGLAASALAALAWPWMVFAPDLKADWRAAAVKLAQADPSGAEPVVVMATDPFHNVEVETARYYLGPRRAALALPPDPRSLAPFVGPRFWVAVGVRDGALALTTGPDLRLRRDARVIDVPGLRLIEAGE